MSSTRDAIREHSRLARMRAGQEVPDFVAIPSMPDVRVAIVPLLEGEAQAGVMAAAELTIDQENMATIAFRQRAGVVSDVFHALRETGDPTKRIYESVDEMLNGDMALEPTDIDYFSDYLATLMDYASPAIDKISTEELMRLKNAFGETDLSALSGKQWGAVKLLSATLFPGLLTGNSPGTTSTDS